MERGWMMTGGIAAALAVAFGAFGAHALEGRLDAGTMSTYETAVRYHMYTALGLLAVALAAGRRPGSRRLRWAGWLLFAGLLIFSGSLYVLCLTGLSWLGMITPLGGFCMVGGWLTLAAGFGGGKGSGQAQS